MFFSLALVAQTVNVMPLASEPHHHLSFHNQYVNVYQVQVAAHESVLLHRHLFDAVSLMLDDAEVTVHAPGKPDVHRTLFAGQIRLQPREYVHSTTVEGNTPYRNITVELLLPQERARNLCSGVIPDQPLNCPAAGAAGTHSHNSEPQFETDETFVDLLHVPAHQKISVGNSRYSTLAIALGADLAMQNDHTKPERLLSSGEFWIGGGHVPLLVKNNGDKESAIVVFTFRHP